MLGVQSQPGTLPLGGSFMNDYSIYSRAGNERLAGAVSFLRERSPKASAGGSLGAAPLMIRFS